MPFDGVSYTDPGFRVALPSEMNIKAEMSSQAQAKVFIKKLDETHNVNPDGKNNSNNQQDSKKNKDKEQSEDENPDDKTPVSIGKSKEVVNYIKYKVSYNHTSDMVELTDKKTGKIIEVVSPKDLMTIVSKSKNASGILVDRVI